MEFTLAHGTANDFVVLADLEDRIELSPRLARALTDRRRGLGGDGVLRIAPGDHGAHDRTPGAGGAGGDRADVFMDHRNADGTAAEMCGNGVRVVAKHVVDHGLVAPADGDTVRIGTRAGVKPVVVHRGPDGLVDEVTVDMGPPVVAPDEVPFKAEDPAALLHRIEVDGDRTVEVAVVSMGNPHAVLRVDDVGVAPVADLGPRLEIHPRFPARTNVGFAEVVARDTVRLRVWERGVGETAACGTGACAAVVALQRLGRLDDEVAVELPGGRLTIRHSDGGTVTMAGPAVEIGHGRIDDAWLAAALRGETEA